MRCQHRYLCLHIRRGNASNSCRIGGTLARVLRRTACSPDGIEIAAAKAAGKFKGRKPTARAKAGEIRKLASERVGKVEIARRLAGVSERPFIGLSPRRRDRNPSFSAAGNYAAAAAQPRLPSPGSGRLSLRATSHAWSRPVCAPLPRRRFSAYCGGRCALILIESLVYAVQLLFCDLPFKAHPAVLGRSIYSSQYIV
jgi:hypothetical protein